MRQHRRCMCLSRLISEHRGAAETHRQYRFPTNPLTCIAEAAFSDFLRALCVRRGSQAAVLKPSAMLSSSVYRLLLHYPFGSSHCSDFIFCWQGVVLLKQTGAPVQTGAFQNDSNCLQRRKRDSGALRYQIYRCQPQQGLPHKRD